MLGREVFLRSRLSHRGHGFHRHLVGHVQHRPRTGVVEAGHAVDDETVARYHRAVAGALELPLLPYHIPQRSKVDLPAALLAGLAGEGVVRGIKDSAGDLELQARLRSEAGPAFAILDGKATVVADSLAQGADGAVLAVADAAPEIAGALLAAHAAGDVAGARAIQERLRPLAGCLGPRYGVAGIKAALDLRGWPGGGSPRAPLEPVGAEGRREIAGALDDRPSSDDPPGKAVADAVEPRAVGAGDDDLGNDAAASSSSGRSGCHSGRPRRSTGTSPACQSGA